MNIEKKTSTLKALIIGHFSTFGDLIVLNHLREYLKIRKINSDIYTIDDRARRETDSIENWSDIDPLNYRYLILCCGPYSKNLLDEKGIKLSEFKHCVRAVYNTTMVSPISEWSPFHVLFERDSDHDSRVEAAFSLSCKPKPLIATCFVEKQIEYGERENHSKVIQTVSEFMKTSTTYSVVDVDTKYPLRINKANIKSHEDFISIVGKANVLITNRLHGTVLGLLSGTPVIAIDGIKGGDKLTKQCEKIGWPLIINGDQLTNKVLEESINWCSTTEAKRVLDKVVYNARKKVTEDTELFMELLVNYPENIRLEDGNSHINQFGDESKIGRRKGKPLRKILKKTILLWRDYLRSFI